MGPQVGWEQLVKGQGAHARKVLKAWSATLELKEVDGEA